MASLLSALLREDREIAVALQRKCAPVELAPVSSGEGKGKGKEAAVSPSTGVISLSDALEQALQLISTTSSALFELLGGADDVLS
jgi:hypothetical protein